MEAIMKKTMIGAIALIALPMNAGAADFPVKTPTPYASYDWSGLYIGAHAGWGTADTAGYTNNNGATVPDNGPTDQTMRGWLGGSQFGYNHQFGRTVLGIEFSGSWSNLNGQSVGTVPGILATSGSGLAPPMSLGCAQALNVQSFSFVSTSVSCNAKVDRTFQAVTRLGYTFGDGRFLPYIEGGVALSRLNVATTIKFSNPTAPLVDTDVFGKSSELAGIVLGAGAQYAVGNGFSIGVEYLYTRYPSQDFSNIGTFTCTSSANGCLLAPFFLSSFSFAHTVQENHDLTTNSVRVVLNYKFAG
jgi:outer membrane immunogenic protein